MNAVSFPDEADEPCPPTERVPASGLAELLARIRQEDTDTLSRPPSFDLLALSTGADGDAVARMRAHYANGETAEALAVAASIGASACLAYDPS